MIPYEIDPSLHAAEPEPPVLDDGFSPRPHHEVNHSEAWPHAAGVDTSLSDKSAF
ncbi:MAG: hypothetical protein ABIR26_10430 [Ramlibacter sp.]